VIPLREKEEIPLLNITQQLNRTYWVTFLAMFLLTLSAAARPAFGQALVAANSDVNPPADTSRSNSTEGKKAPSNKKSAKTPDARLDTEKSNKTDKPKAANSEVEDRVKALEDELRAQSEKILEMSKTVADQQRTIERLSSGAVRSAADAPASQPVNLATPTTPITPEKAVAAQKAGSEDGPLTFHIGSASITPVGFMDFTAVYRSTTGGSGIGTNFGSIPFGGTSTTGNLSEFRFSAQNSRIGFRVDAEVLGAKVLGYFESDFLGNNPGNVSVSSNSDTNRLRLYWVDVKKGKLELLGGQSWDMLTPGRKGISPLPGDLFFSQDVDVNYQVGLTWTRQPQFRIIYHPSDTVALGVALEEPEQYIGGSGGGGLITFPTALATPYGAQLNNGGTTLTVPNLMPDIVTKIAFDPKVGGHDLHIEAAGLFRKFKVFNPANLQKSTTTGAGGSVNLNFEVVKNVRFLTNNFVSDGGGRYIFGEAPDLIVHGDGTLSAIHAYSTVTGFEATVKKNTLLYGYYGGVYIKRNTTIDPANGKLVGYGYSGSPNSQNRSIQEATFGLTQTFWRDPKYGALQFMLQYSYLVRKPWFVAAGGLPDAHINMIFVNLRYALPGKAPSK
jgi:hypothetical protein